MMKRFRIALLAIALLTILLAGCSSTQSATTGPDEGSAVRSKAVGSADEGSQTRSKAVGEQENTDIISNSDSDAE